MTDFSGFTCGFAVSRFVEKMHATDIPKNPTGDLLYGPSSNLMSALEPRDVWPLHPGITFLNHGSFGSCPKPVRDAQDHYRACLESEPIDFLVRDLEPLLDKARGALASFIGATPKNLVFVPNVTTGINAVLRSLRFSPGDELLVTNQEYNACRNVLNYVAELSGATVVVAEIPFPIADPAQAIEVLRSALTPRTRLALVDHVTSQTGVVLPIPEIIQLLRERGVLVLVDGSHAPGMIPLFLDAWAPDFYTANCHKWICAPKGAGFLVVNETLQSKVRPTVISHGANSSRTDRSRYLIEFAWPGTHDPSAFLSVPHALEFMATLLPGGWPALMARNRALALAARAKLCDTLGVPPPAPESMIGSLAAVPIAEAHSECRPTSPLYIDSLQETLRWRHNIEVPVIPWPAFPKRLLRISAQVYNSLDQYDALCLALTTLNLESEPRGSNRRHLS